MGKIIMLGTGDPLNDERAQSSLAMPLGDGEILLIDTSSGTVLLRQLHAAGLDLAGIRHIVVSHRHFDHAGGLAPLLTALAGVPGGRVTVHAMPETLGSLHDLLALTIPGVESWLGDRLQWNELADGLAVRAGSAEITPFAVEHGLECIGLRIVHGHRLTVFSADTRPCPSIVSHARDADLLVHEVYGLENTAKEAHAYGHSTAVDAGRAARASGARRLLLTHFRSSRHVDPAELGAAAAEAFGSAVELAHDVSAVEI